MVYAGLLRVFPGLAVIGWLTVAGAYLVRHKRMAKSHQQMLVGGVPYPRRWGTIPPGEKTPSRPLHLKPGELVQVRTYREIGRFANKWALRLLYITRCPGNRGSG